MTPLVGGDHVVAALGEHVDPVAEVLLGPGEAVDQQQRSSADARLGDRQAHVAHVDLTLLDARTEPARLDDEASALIGHAVFPFVRRHGASTARSVPSGHRGPAGVEGRTGWEGGAVATRAGR